MNKVTTKGIPESLLARLWHHLRLEGGTLTTPSGQKVQVIYPGTPNREAGPDFRQAILATDSGELITGDVEVDLRSSFWWQHGHNRNPRYQEVAFQVTPHHDSRKKIQAEKQGVQVLELTLPSQDFDYNFDSLGSCPALAREDKETIVKLVGWAGEFRFRSKSERFQKALERKDPGQVLYEGLMESLGYSLNKAPFCRLAQLLSLRELNRLASKKRPHLYLPSLLLGTAGLLPSQSGGAMEKDNPVVDRLEKEWLFGERRQLLARKDWRFFKVRPINTPTRRLVAAAYLLTYQWLPDPSAHFLPLLEISQHLEKSLRVPAGEYWIDHLDFGIPAPYSPILLGQERSRDMVINIVLPFFYAWGSLRGWRWLRSRTLELYIHYPAGAENLISRFMRNKLRGIALNRGARHQQGLLHLYHSYCSRHRCVYCPLIRTL